MGRKPNILVEECFDIDIVAGTAECKLCRDVKKLPVRKCLKKVSNGKKSNLSVHLRSHREADFRIFGSKAWSNGKLNSSESRADCNGQETSSEENSAALPEFSSSERPECVGLLKDDLFLNFMKLAGTVMETPEAFQESINNKIEALAGELEYATLQAEEVDFVGGRFVKFDLVFVNDRFETVRLNLLFKARDSAEDSTEDSTENSAEDLADERNQLIEELIEKLKNLKIRTKIIRIESKDPTNELFKQAADQLEVELAKPMANAISEAVEKKFQEMLPLDAFCARFDRILNQTSKSTKLLEEIQTADPDVTELNLSALPKEAKLRHKLDLISRALTENFHTETGFDHHSPLKEQKLFEDEEEKRFLEALRVEFEPVVRKLEKIENPNNKSKLIALAELLEDKIKKVQIERFDEKKRPQVQGAKDALVACVSRWIESLKNDLTSNWLNFLDCRTKFKGRCEYALEQEFEQFRTTVARCEGKNNEESLSDADSDSGHIFKKRRLTDEFEDFKRETTYNQESPLPSIYQEISKRRFPVISQIFKSQFCRENFISEFAVSDFL